MIKPAQRDQMVNGQFIGPAFIARVHGLGCAQNVGHLLLGQTGVFTQITHDFAVVQVDSLPSLVAGLIGQNIQHRQNILFLRFGQHPVTGHKISFAIIQSDALHAFIRVDFKKFRH